MSEGRIAKAYMIICLSAFILFLQFGQNEFLSAQFLSFILLLVVCARYLKRMPLKIPLVVSLLFIIIFLSSIVNGRELHFILMGLRTCTAMGIVFLINMVAERRGCLGWSYIVQRSVYYSIVVSIFLSLLQFFDSYYLNSGNFDVPETWFSLDYGTLFYDRRSELVDYFVRPSGTYSEPSALGVLGLLGLFIAYGNQNNRLKYLSFSLCLLSSSIIALVFALGFLVYYEIFSSRKASSFLLVFIVLSVVLSSAVLLDMRLMERIDRVFSGGDVSSNIRLFGPLEVIKEMIVQGYWLGVSDSILENLMPDHISRVVDTWMFNQIIFYGILGIIIIFLAFYVSPRRTWPFLVAIMVANGDAFYYDRLFLFVLAILGSVNGSQKTILKRGRVLIRRTDVV